MTDRPISNDKSEGRAEAKSERGEERGEQLSKPLQSLVNEAHNLGNLSNALYSGYGKDQDKAFTKQDLKDAQKDQYASAEDKMAIDYALKNFDKLSKNGNSITKQDLDGRTKDVTTDALVKLAQSGKDPHLDAQTLNDLGKSMPRDKDEAAKFVNELNEKLKKEGVNAKFSSEVVETHAMIGGSIDMVLSVQQANGDKYPVGSQNIARMRC